MATLTIRRLSDRTHAGLRQLAAVHGRSVEAEVRAILDATVHPPQRNLLAALHTAVAERGGFDLEIAARSDSPRNVDIA